MPDIRTVSLNKEPGPEFKTISVLPPSSLPPSSPDPKEIAKTEAAKEIPPFRNPNGTLTRYGMETVISQGGTVRFADREYRQIKDLPTEEQVQKFYDGITKRGNEIRAEQMERHGSK